MTKGRFFCSASAFAALFALGASGQAQAQAQTSPTEIGEVVVTGSFIRGTPEDAALPVDVISAEDIEKQGAPSTLELIKQLPVSSGVLGDTNQFDLRAQGSEGSGSVNLRGLGAGRTLVLLNGRRMSTNPFAAGVVDTNTLPSAAIGRVEVLKDGAAATYGSDAIGGVINFITRSNFDGLEVGGSYRHVDGSKGDYDVSALWGWTSDVGNILVSFGHQHRSELRVIDRDWAARPFSESAEGGWSGANSTAPLVPIAQTATGAWVPIGTGQAGIFGVLDNGCTPLGGVALGGAIPSCRFQYTQFDNLVEMENRYQVYAEANAKLSENHELHIETLYAKTDVPNWKTSSGYLALQTPTPVTSPSASTLSPAVLLGYFVPANNPGLIAYRAANPTAIPAAATGIHLPGVLYRPFAFGGNPLFPENDGASEGLRQYESFRVSGGLKGDLPWGGIGYDVSVTYGQEVARRTGYDALVGRLQLALRGFGSLAGDAAGGCTSAETNGFTTNAGNQAVGCYFFNPLSNAIPSNSITGQANPGYNAAVANNVELVRWLFPQLATKQKQRLFVVDAVINGQTGIELGGGPVAWAAGVQFRQDGFESNYTDLTNRAVNPCIDTPINGSKNCAVQSGPFLFLNNALENEIDREVYATFAELSVPVTDDIQIQLAARYEDYQGAAGSTFNPKASVRWQATDWLAFRGSVGTTFRGPPLASVSPTTGTAFSFIAGSFRAIDITGNPDLDPETADTYSAGAIFNVGRLKATIDYWRFDLEKLIGTEPGDPIVATMFPAGGVVTAATHPCNNPAFAALKARFTFQGACSTATIARLQTFVVNGPDVKTSGIDVLAEYDFGEVFMGGDVRVGASATHTLEYKIDDFEVGGVVVQPAFDAAGYLNYLRSATSLPDWKGSAFFEYSNGPHNLRVTANHVSSYRDQRVLPANLQTGIVSTKGQKIKSITLVEVDYRVQLPWDTTVVASIDNIFDKDPSFARLDLNYDPFTGNALGRTFKLAVKKRF